MKIKQNLTMIDSISILAGIMIGSGIFFLGGQILYRAENSLWLSILAWVVGGMITLFSGLTYAELGSLFPTNGGYYVYLKEGYGKPVAFLSGFMNMILSSSGSIALLAILFGQVINTIFPTANDISVYIGIVAIILLTVFNYIGLRFGSLIQTVTMIVKLVPILLIIILGLFLGNETLVTTSTIADRSFTELMVAFGFAVVGTLWAYEGWTNLNSIAGHMKDAKKDLPKALTIAILGVMAIYILFIISLYRLVSYQDLLDNGWFIFNAAYQLFGDAGQLVVMISVGISVFGALNGVILVFPRVYQKMANDGLFFKALAKEDTKFKTPTYAILLSSGISILLMVLGFDINSLLTFVVFAGLIFNLLIFISLFKFRKTKPVTEFPRYQVWGYPYVPMIAIAGMLLLIISTVIESLVPSIIGLGILTLGYVIFIFTQKNAIK